MKSSLRLNHLILLTGVLLFQAGCSLLFDSMLTDAARESRLEMEIEKVQKTCSGALTQGNAYVALKPEARRIGSMRDFTGQSDVYPDSLDFVSRQLSRCREEIGDILRITIKNNYNEEVKVVQEPTSEGFELGGSKVSFADAYRQAFELEKKVLDAKLDACSVSRGTISSQGDGINNWTPLQVHQTEWVFEECDPDSKSWAFNSSTPAEQKEIIQDNCEKAHIWSGPFQTERVDLNLYEKTARFGCQGPKERKTGTAFKGAPKETPRCEVCKAWMK